MKHPQIRAAVLNALKDNITDSVTWFDGRPAFLEVQDLPAVAVYLTDAQFTGAMVDEDQWSATLHIEVFLKADLPDAALDEWMESRIYPVLSDIPGLSDLIELMTPLGYDYQRDEDMSTWGAADMQYSITYIM
ncbi:MULTISPECIES: phage minor tail U family protein [Phytobacter]|uniref:Tail protein n=1 Tax=Phytobacter diazotrophicus TaxID=395631 RepID=A0ABN6LSJ2_9ENTR|nr:MULTISPECIES: phage minor tail U family protein [Phytobacter]BBE76912.1 tail protein [Phytobacter sp. MRY16-398]BBE78449.1 tail protein [Phytobacter sp. MRY16-398]BDD50381.1 tail protein [Phytobacter diazotrophicus]BDD51822.1 tail protein [Phytobacter diazotrophicus]BEG81409.1 phage tail terminator protein [Phytobacter diazotrophicus]